MVWFLIAFPLLAALAAFLTPSTRLRVRLLPVVGTLHLVGRDGLLELLRQRGYSASQQ